MCYILVIRFPEYNNRILYDPIAGHFITHIYNDKYSRYYDVRGDVTDMYRDVLLFDLEIIYKEDRDWHDRLLTDCFLYKER